jgi:hypothetical protein
LVESHRNSDGAIVSLVMWWKLPENQQKQEW